MAKQKSFHLFTFLMCLCWMSLTSLQTQVSRFSAAGTGSRKTEFTSPEFTSPIISITTSSTTVKRKATATTSAAAADNGGVSGRQIVEKAYQRSFSTFETCPKNHTFRSCIRRKQIQLEMQQHQLEQQQQAQMSANNSNNNTASPSSLLSFSPTWPWWFHTMLRDAWLPNANHSEVFGPWHNLTIAEPHLHMCVIEKIGTKHWRKFQCKMNGFRNNETSFIGRPCQLNMQEIQALRNATRTRGPASTTVFLRDPLERFLSGFLDKCKRESGRKHENHCKPLAVFQNDSALMTLGLVNNKRRFFEAYVDTMPLQWDLHFFPQSLYCDGLFRHIQDYDFVGHMGQHFYQDVQKFRLQFSPPHDDDDSHHPINVDDNTTTTNNNNTNSSSINVGNSNSSAANRFHNALEDVFQLEKNLKEPVGRNVGVETSASSYVLEYYTPSTVRRVLEYMAIDYVRLDIPIPVWAQEMLDREEEEEEKQQQQQQQLQQQY